MHGHVLDPHLLFCSFVLNSRSCIQIVLGVLAVDKNHIFVDLVFFYLC